MIFKAKRTIHILEKHYLYEQCYKDMYINGRVYIYPKNYGKCTGKYSGYKHSLDCKFCPYYVEVKNE